MDGAGLLILSSSKVENETCNARRIRRALILADVHLERDASEWQSLNHGKVADVVVVLQDSSRASIWVSDSPCNEAEDGVVSDHGRVGGIDSIDGILSCLVQIDSTLFSILIEPEPVSLGAIVFISGLARHGGVVGVLGDVQSTLVTAQVKFAVIDDLGLSSASVVFIASSLVSRLISLKQEKIIGTVGDVALDFSTEIVELLKLTCVGVHALLGGSLSHVHALGHRWIDQECSVALQVSCSVISISKVKATNEITVVIRGDKVADA